MRGLGLRKRTDPSQSESTSRSWRGVIAPAARPYTGSVSMRRCQEDA